MQKIWNACALMLLMSSTMAHAETLYQVEIIAFARDSAEAENEENWDKHYNLRYPERSVNLQSSNSSDTAGSNSSFQLLSADAMQLNKEADVIAGRRNMRVLLHQAWRQTVDDPARATAVLIDGGKQFGVHHELEGTFTLSVEHFLRADANLWLSRFSSNAGVDAQVLPIPPGASDDAGDAHYAVTQTVVLQEQRRMRSGELHYFDHPLIGLLVLVTPMPAAQ
ncbi:MAG TPA: CsiV family protein [Spongiibacteraceae bacterium]|jgi:hypothetical protein